MITERIRFYVDEHVPRAVTEGLRRRGVGILTPREAGLIAADDPQHLAFALQEGPVIFTQDADFLRLHSSHHPRAGIVYAKQQTPIGTIMRGLMLIFDVLTPEDMAGHVEFL